MKDNYYILEGKEHKKVDVIAWAKWIQNYENKKMKLTEEDEWFVSTVFLGIDHNFIDDGKELLYETMAFNSKTELDTEPFRYETYEEAEKGHDEIVKKVKELLSNK